MGLESRRVFQIAYTNIKILIIQIVLKDGRMKKIIKRVRV